MDTIRLIVCVLNVVLDAGILVLLLMMFRK